MVVLRVRARRPIDARWVLIASLSTACASWASRSHSTRLSATSDGSIRPGRGIGGCCGDGRLTG
ncbi:hypothetical protein C5746_02745 [Streptomyces atratus]|uniref:Uncharacterized protein n=1 Tax=Streptomyces atratus TaxID=1893 RepID=A0A2Z5J6V9_STRAR|nr:hypothetical protein C5746_02745 [Streptomyces atratus]